MLPHTDPCHLLSCTPALPLPQADVVTVSTLIACCERLGDWQRAQAVWEWMTAQVRAPTLALACHLGCLARSSLALPQRPFSLCRPFC